MASETGGDRVTGEYRRSGSACARGVAMSRMAESEALSSSYVKGTTEISLVRRTIGSKLNEIAANNGPRVALACPSQQVRWTYSELQRHVDDLASGLMQLGLEAGDRIGIWCPNRAEWTVTQYAAAKLGAILVCINPAYRALELERAVNSVGCKALIVTDRLNDNDYIERVREVAPEASNCAPGKLNAARLPTLAILIKLGNEPAPGFFRYSDVLELGCKSGHEAVAAANARVRPEDPVAILFTSGTTGGAKGATFNHWQLLGNGFIDGSIMEVSATDGICVPLPLYHIFGMLTGNLIALLFAAKVVYSGESFDPASVLSSIETEKCTIVYGVPTTFKAMLDHPDRAAFDLTSLRTGLIAGAAVPYELCVQLVEKLHIPQLLQVYGMTEASATITIPDLHDPLERRVGTAGRVIPHLEIKLIDPAGRIVPVGAPGELCFRGFSATQGYWRDPVKTAEAIDEDGWFHTGDLATVDEAGYFRIVGRIKEIIIRGGENIHPGDIEQLLASHPKVLGTCIVGVPDSKYGEELCACIQLKPGDNATADEFRDFCKPRISHYKVPKYFQFVTEFPMTATGKIQRLALKQRFASIGGKPREV